MIKEREYLKSPQQEGGEGADHTLEMWDMGEMGEYHLKTGG